MLSNTSRTLEYIRGQGWVADKVERYNPYAGKYGVRQDMFGFGDIIAMGEGHIWAIQSCGQDFYSHHKKITENELVAPNVELWLKNGGYLLLISWAKHKIKRGGKAMRWRPKIRQYYLENGEIKWKEKA